MTIENLTDKIHRVKFKEWTRLEDLLDAVRRAVEDKADDFPKSVYACISTASSIEEKELAELPWQDCVTLFYLANKVNIPSDILPIVVAIRKKQDIRKAPWDYDGRTWHLYSHLIAQAYGWTLDYIAGLEIEDALAAIQEILLDEQLEREFYWGMSEAAYSYNKTTKTSKFIPLPRPYWMEDYSKVKNHGDIARIPKRLLPIGNIISLNKKDENSKAPTSES